MLDIAHPSQFVSDAERLRHDASSMDEARFVAINAGRFLVVEGQVGREVDPLALRTRTVAAVRRDQPRQALEVMPVRKRADGNPYSSMVTIGRARNNDVVLNDPSVSKMHAWIRLACDTLHGHDTLTDSGATNGTFLHGKPVRNESVALCVGDRIRIGSVDLRFIDARLLYHALRRVRGPFAAA